MENIRGIRGPMASKLKKKCPVCGEEIPEDATICPNCGADLELFEMEEELDEGDLVPLESFLDSIGDAEDVDPEKILEEMRKIIQTSDIGVGSEEKPSEQEENLPEEKEEEGAEVSEFEEVEEETGESEETGEEVEEEGEVEYVCPVCGGVVGADDKVCPHCGAIFVETEEEMEEALEEQLEQAKQLIKEMREKGIDVSEVTPFLKNANLARRKGDVEAALENAIHCVLRAKEKLGSES